jgi:hypothetical protein
MLLDRSGSSSFSFVRVQEPPFAGRLGAHFYPRGCVTPAGARLIEAWIDRALDTSDGTR